MKQKINYQNIERDKILETKEKKGYKKQQIIRKNLQAKDIQAN